jgi:hypothetical protein
VRKDAEESRKTRREMIELERDEDELETRRVFA